MDVRIFLLARYIIFNIKEKKQFPLYSVSLILGITTEHGEISIFLLII